MRSPEDQLVIELAKVSYIHMHYRSETESTHSSPKSGADVPGTMQSSSESMGTIICSVDVKWNSASIVAVGYVQSSASDFGLPPIFIAMWDTEGKKCSNNPACVLWDERMLLNSR